MISFFSQLQGYNAMYKFLCNYEKNNKSDDISSLLGDMLFFPDGGTADPATWGEWQENILKKEKITKQEAFDGMVKFVKKYGERTSSRDTLLLVERLCLAKNCNDISVPLVKQWNLFLKEALSEPEGEREYFFRGDPMQRITRKQTFNTIYKLLDIYSKQLESKEIVSLAEGMLFLSDGKTTLDADVRIDWKKILGDTIKLTKQESFNITILFLEAYGDRVASVEMKSIASKMRLAKDCDDVTVPLVDLWNFCLVESLNESAGARKYLQITKE